MLNKENLLNNKPNLFERSLQISANQYTLENSTINRINSNHLVEQYILKSQKNSYLINLINKNSKLQLNPISSKETQRWKLLLLLALLCAPIFIFLATTSEIEAPDTTVTYDGFSN